MSILASTERFILDGRVHHRHQQGGSALPTRSVADLYEMCDDCEEMGILLSDHVTSQPE